MARLAADLVVLIHALFIVFVVGGGLLVLRWPRLSILHLPCALWGACIAFGGWICPLTPLEKALRESAGTAGYEGGFVEHYVIPIIYPGELTRGIQVFLGVLVLAVNGVVYGWVIVRWRQRRRAGD